MFGSDLRQDFFNVFLVLLRILFDVVAFIASSDANSKFCYLRVAFMISVDYVYNSSVIT